MNKLLLNDIELQFSVVENLYNGNEISDGKISSIISRLRYLRKECNLKLVQNEKSFLIYCIDTMIQTIEENNHKKIVHFANISKQVVHVYQKKALLPYVELRNQ